MNKKILQRVASVGCFLLLVISASQCFAQSSSSSSKTANDADLYSKNIANIMGFLQQNYVEDVDLEVLYKGALKGMMESLEDPYTTYLDVDSMRSLSDTTSGSFGGVGLSITKRIADTPDKPSYVEVVSPIENGPGDKEGIIAGDLITAIDDIPTHDLTMEEVLAHLRGKIGESVKVSILRGKNIEFSKTLIRELIEVPTVKYTMIGSIGYLRIIEFTPETAKRVQEGIDEFKKNNFTSLIIDLRNNPGGLITSVVDVADKFIDSGTIVSTKSRNAYSNSSYTASRIKTTMPKNIPIAVLINKGSASASEILSGALKDYHLAYLVGQNTYGKGSVQQVIQMTKTEGFKMTIARYYTPSDTNIDKVGIPPDREVLYPELTDEEEKAYEKLITDDVIAPYVESHSGMTESDIDTYSKTLYETYPLDLRTLRRIIRLQVNRYKGEVLYDLDYDIQLNAAIDILKNENFADLMKSTKTVKELTAAK